MRELLTVVLWAMLGAGCSVDNPDASAGTGMAPERGTPGSASDEAAAGQGYGLLPVAQAQGSLPPGVSRLQPTTIMDPGGFEKPVVAATALAPVGWRTQGGYVWNVGNPCSVSDYTLSWSLLAPDGISAVAFVTKPKWSIVKSFLQYDRGPPGPCEGPNWTTAQQYLESLVLQTSTEAQILDYQPRPDLMQQQEAMNKMVLMPPSDDQVQNEMHVDAGQILFAHTLNGREVREMIVALVIFNRTRIADVMNPGRIGMDTREGIPVSVVYARAPAGGLNVLLPGVIAKSMRLTADWSNRIFQFNMEKQRRAFEQMIQNGNNSAAQLQIMREAHERSMADMQSAQVQRDKMNDLKVIAGDKNQREYVEMVRGVETYREPVEGGVVQLDNTYDHAWRVRDGSYLLTNDPNFRPGLVGLEGQELRRVE